MLAQLKTTFSEEQRISFTNPLGPPLHLALFTVLYTVRVHNVHKHSVHNTQQPTMTVQRPNSESKEETSASGQGFNINSTQLFII